MTNFSRLEALPWSSPSSPSSLNIPVIMDDESSDFSEESVMKLWLWPFGTEDDNIILLPRPLLELFVFLEIGLETDSKVSLISGLSIFVYFAGYLWWLNSSNKNASV